MTIMAFENINDISLREVEKRIGYWKDEYPDLEFFIANIRGESHIIGSDNND